MLYAAIHRFHPRSGHERDKARREAAVRAQVLDLSDRISALEKEQHTQFRRIAEIQQQLDDVVRLLKELKNRT